MLLSHGERLWEDDHTIGYAVELTAYPVNFFRGIVNNDSLPFKKDAVYELLKRPRHNWRKFMLCLVVKVISCLKNRLGNFEPELRELKITADGILVGEQLNYLRGLLTGVPESNGECDKPEL